MTRARALFASGFSLLGRHNSYPGRTDAASIRGQVYVVGPQSASGNRVRAEGFEPPCSVEHRHLKPARKPIPARPRGVNSRPARAIPSWLDRAVVPADHGTCATASVRGAKPRGRSQMTWEPLRPLDARHGWTRGDPTDPGARARRCDRGAVRLLGPSVCAGSRWSGERAVTSRREVRWSSCTRSGGERSRSAGRQGMAQSELSSGAPRTRTWSRRLWRPVPYPVWPVPLAARS